MSFKKGIVVSIDPSNALARVQFQDSDNVVSFWLHVGHKKTHLDKDYWMPDKGELVACVLDDNGEDGVIICALYSEEDTPPTASKDKWVKKFADGTVLEYDRGEHKLTADVKGAVKVAATGEIAVNAPTAVITAEVTINGNTTINGNFVLNGNGTASGTLTASDMQSDNGISLISHIHSGVQTGGSNTGQPNS
ncbi:MAG: phage baseplate assembly protein V [Campylobacterales bacterium]|nr:phage baseplate assembly protein V [Campylobacterales bacterium]